VLAGGLTLPAPRPAEAQAAPSWPAPGTRVRVTGPCESTGGVRLSRQCRLTGGLVRTNDGVIVLAGADSTVEFRLADLESLEVSRGTQSWWLLGAGAGLIVGGVATWAVTYHGGSTSLCDRSANQDALNSTECAGVVALGAVVGAALGAGIGSLIRTERWETVLAGPPGIGLTPRGGVQLRLKLGI